MQTDDFSLSSEEAKILLHLKRHQTLEELGKFYQRDPSVISRRLKEISLKEAVLVKEEGQWRLTQLGEEFAAWAQDSIQIQKRIIQKKQLIRIATTREFASLVLSPGLDEFIDFTKYRVELVSTDEGVERSLLTDRADIGFDCGVPYSPEIAFRALSVEEMGLVASPTYSKLRADKIYKNSDEYIHFSRNDLKIFYELTEATAIPKVTCHDISSVRSLILAGKGWSYLPYYTVSELVAKKKLNYFPHPFIKSLKFGLWWPRQSNRHEAIIRAGIEWLKKQDLTLSS